MTHTSKKPRPCKQMSAEIYLSGLLCLGQLHHASSVDEKEVLSRDELAPAVRASDPVRALDPIKKDESSSYENPLYRNKQARINFAAHMQP